MAEWNMGELETNGVRLHYLRANNGKPPLLLAHGLTDAGACWLPMAEQLVGDYEVVMYDARGHGHSSHPATGYSYDDLAADMAGLIAGLGLAQPVVLGHSMGGATAGLLAARFPTLVRAIVLEDPPTQGKPAVAVDDAFFRNWRADLLAQQALGREGLIAKGTWQSPRWSDAELGHWADAKLQASPDTLELIREPGTLWVDHVAEITCPILLLTADPARGSAVAPDVAARVQREWHDGRLVQIDGAGHSVHRDAPEAFLAAVRAFLAEF